MEERVVCEEDEDVEERRVVEAMESSNIASNAISNPRSGEI